MEGLDTDKERNNCLHQRLAEGIDFMDVRDFQVELKRFLSGQTKDLIQLLLNSRNIYGNTPLMEYLSFVGPRYEIVSELLRFNCDVNISNDLEMSALHKVISMQYIPERILEGKFLGDMERNIVNQQQQNENEIFRLLLAAGADVNKQDIFGRTPLFLANDIYVIKTLMKNGADVNIADRCGRTVLLSALNLANSDYLVNFYVSIMSIEQVLRPDIFGSNCVDYARLLQRNDLKEKIEGVICKKKPTQSSDSGITLLYERKTFQKALVDLKETDCVHFNDVMRTDDLSFAVKRHPTAIIVSEILNQPGLGAPKYNDESENIITTINGFAAYLCTSISELDPRLKCNLFPSGSSSEGTKAGDPTEFDFVFCLEEFSKMCEIKDVIGKQGFAELEHSINIIPDKYKMFFNENRKCKATEVRYVFSKLLQRIVLTRTTWQNEHLYFDGDVKHLEEYDRPVFTLKLLWLGFQYKYEEISLDIVPAVRKYGWWPTDTDFSVFDNHPKIVYEEGCLLLLQNPYEEADTLFRISSSPAEISLIRSLPWYFRAGYRLSKLLRYNRFCPLMNPDPEEDYFPDFEADDSITSYMLKNCLFYILKDVKIQHTTQETGELELNKLIVDIAIRILKYFKKCAVRQTLPVYFIPKREDIFRFNFKEMDNVDDQTVEKLNNFHCLRREAFTKIMLYILGE